VQQFNGSARKSSVRQLVQMAGLPT